MVPGPDGVDIFAASLRHELVGHALGNAVDAAYSGHNPYLVAHANVAVLAYIALEGTALVLDMIDVALGVNGIVGIFQRTREVGLQVVLVHPVAGLHVLTGVTDWVAVLDDILTFFDVLDQYFMSCRGVLVHCDLLAVYLYDVALLLGGQTYYDRVSGINLQKCC